MSTIARNPDPRNFDSQTAYFIVVPEGGNYVPVYFPLPSGDWSNSFDVYLRTIDTSDSGSWGWRLEPGGGSGYANGIASLELNAYVNNSAIGNWLLTAGGQYFVLWVKPGRYFVQCEDNRVGRAIVLAEPSLTLDGTTISVLSAPQIELPSVAIGKSIRGDCYADDFVLNIGDRSLAYIRSIPNVPVGNYDLNDLKFRQTGAWEFLPENSHTFANLPLALNPGNGFFVVVKSSPGGNSGIQSIYSVDGNIAVNRTFSN